MAPVVDTHVHAGKARYEPVESLLDQMERHRVAHAVLVQHGGQFDNSYLVECAERSGGRFAVVCLVDAGAPGAADSLTRWAERSRTVQGVRVYLRDLLAGAAGAEQVWRRADELGMNLQVAGTLTELASEAAAAAIGRVATGRVHIEHLGHPDPDEPFPYERYRRVLALAAHEHVALKVSGFYSFTRLDRAPYLDTLTYVALALEAFGARRMMWGSDFPPVSSAEGYGNALTFAAETIPLASSDDREQLLGGTAIRQWRFGSTATVPAKVAHGP